MTFHRITSAEILKGIGIGIAIAVVTAVIMQMLAAAGISPLPKPLGLAFAETVLGTGLPLPVGLLFHTVWIIGWTLAYLILWRDALTLGNAFILATLLWVGVLVIFFPLVGWGFLGLAVTPRLIIAAGLIHAIFAILLWGAARWAFQTEPAR